MKGKTWMAGALCSIVLLQSICSQTILAVYADTLTLNEQNIMQTESASAAFSMSESMVNQSVSDHTISNHTISNNTISNNTVSDNTVSDNTISDNTASDHTVSGNTISDNTISENIIRRSFQLHMEYVDESICADAKKQNERREKYLNFLQQITDFPTQISYEEQMYAFLADTREQADLIALVYSGTILSYEEGVATMQIEGYSTAEVLTACLEEEAAAAPVIYPIEYTETEVDGSNESSEEMLLLTKDEAGRVQICDQPNTQLNEQPQNTRLVSTVEQLKAANTALLPPTISIPSGRIQEGWGFRLYNSNSLGQIYYTTDGTTPTKHSLSYHIEKDEKGLIYVPENNTKVTIKAIVVYQDQKSKILTTNYLVSPYTIAINDASHRYVTSLNKLGCFSSYYPIRGFTKGTNMPYQLYSVRLNSGDTLTATLEAAGFNGEVYILTNDSVLAHQTGTPETANRPSIPRIARYTNPYNYSLNCIIAVTSGENSAVHRMYLSNGGEYELTVFSAKRAKDVRVSMTKDYMISGRDMFYNVSMVPYDTYNRSSKLELLYEDDTKVPSNVAIINRKKGIVHLYKVNAPTKMKLRATNIDSQAYGEFEFTAYPVIQKMIPKKDRVTLVLTSIRTHDASTNFAMTPLSGYYNQFTYTSSRPQVADVTEAGLVTAYTEGTTVITRQAQDGSKRKSSYVIEVISPITDISIVPGAHAANITGNYPLAQGSRVYLSAVTKPEETNPQKVKFSLRGEPPAGIKLTGNKLTIAENAEYQKNFLVQADATDGYGAVNIKSFRIYKKPVTMSLQAADTVLNTSDMTGTQSTTITLQILGRSQDTEGICQTVVWENTNPEVISFNETTRRVTALKRGKASIRAYAVDGSGLKKEIVFQVEQGVSSIKVKPQKANLPDSTTNYPTAVSRNIRMKAIVAPENASKKRVIWSLESAPEGVKIGRNSGTVTVPKEITSGTIVVCAEAVDGTGCIGKATLTLYTPVKSVSVTAGTKTLNTISKKTTTVTASVLPESGCFSNIRYTSSRPSVATVDETTGVVMAVAKGTTTITATARDGSNKRASVVIKVFQPMTSFAIANQNQISNPAKEPILVSGKTTQMIVSQSIPVNPSNRNVEWSFISPDPDGLVTINSKTGKIKVAGDLSKMKTLTLRADAVDSSAYKTQTIRVYPATKSVNLLNSDKTRGLQVGESYKLTPKSNPVHAYSTYSFTSKKPSVATVSEQGVVTAIRPGTAKIIVKAMDGTNKQVTVNVKVYR